MTNEQFTEITEWQNKTFPNATALSKIIHLKQEVEELQEAESYLKETEAIKELSDCFILLFGIADKLGLNHSTTWLAIEQKMVINKARKWGKPDANGVVNHIKS